MFETPSRRNFSTNPVQRDEKPTRMSGVVIVFIILIIIIFAFAGAVVSCSILTDDTDTAPAVERPNQYPNMDEYFEFHTIEEIPAEEKNTL